VPASKSDDVPRLIEAIEQVYDEYGDHRYAAGFAVYLAVDINVTTGGALTGTSSAGTLDTPATDAALLAAVSSLWSTVSGVVANP
jgi:hypothetical protein